MSLELGTHCKIGGEGVLFKTKPMQLPNAISLVFIVGAPVETHVLSNPSKLSGNIHWYWS